MLHAACRCRPLPVLPAILLLILPKCPLCLGAWFGLFGAVGVSSWIVTAWGLPLGGALVSMAMAALVVRAFRNHDLRPLVPGLLAAVALLAGKQFNDLWLLSLGGSLLLLASLLRPSIKNTKAERNYESQSVCR